jgi:hypothetical protein
MNQLTIRGFDSRLERKIRQLARAEGISLNKAVLRLLRKGAGLGHDGPEHEAVGDSLDHLFGTWTEEEALEFDGAMEDLSKVDPEIWS